jgi:hypothetical protein
MKMQMKETSKESKFWAVDGSVRRTVYTKTVQAKKCDLDVYVNLKPKASAK